MARAPHPGSRRSLPGGGSTLSAAKVDAAFATNVRHYRHTLEAMAADWNAVGFIGPVELSRRRLQQISRFAPNPVARALSRREAAPLPPAVTRYGWNLASALPSLKHGLTGRALSPSQVRSVHESQARTVARRFAGVGFLQAVEGLGHVAMRQGSAQRILVERRNLHHEVFEAEIDTYAGFPFTSRPDPIRDLLEEEYASAERIVVYSDVARRSFLDRGFDPDRVWVNRLPIAMAPPQPPADAERDPRLLLYVGRLDAFKGIDVAVAALAQLPQQYRLVVAGPGGVQEREWLARQARVEYLGVQSRGELAGLYSRAGLLVAPSVESFGLAVLEATRAGLPVVTRETTGVSAYLPSEMVHIVAGRSPSAWAEAIAAHPGVPLEVDWTRSSAVLSYSSAVTSQRDLHRGLVS